MSNCNLCRFRVLFVHLIPCVSLVFLNILLFRAMRQADKKREKLLNSNKKANSGKGESRESRKIRDSNTTTLMLIIVISVKIPPSWGKMRLYLTVFQVFLAVELPMGIVVILHTLSSTIDDFLDYSVAKLVILICNLCICLSYPLNFGIYCGMSRQFRETFKELFFSRGIGRRGSPSFRMVSRIEAGTRTQQNNGGGNTTGNGNKYTLVNGSNNIKPIANNSAIVSTAANEPLMKTEAVVETSPPTGPTPNTAVTAVATITNANGQNETHL